MSPKEQPHNSTVDQLQKLHRRRVTTFGSIILIAGIAIGAALTVILMPHPPKPPSSSPIRMTDRLERVLDLTAEQKEKIRLISKTAFEAIHKAQEDAKPIIDAAIKTMNEDILDVLTKEQRPKWKRYIEEFKNRFRDRWHRGGRRGGDGRGGPDRRRGSGDPDRMRREPGRRMGDPNRPHRGPGLFGPGFGPDDPGGPHGDFDREAMRERYRRGDDPFGRRPRPDEPNRPSHEAITEPKTIGE